jgi:hypothetical protein
MSLSHGAETRHTPSSCPAMDHGIQRINASRTAIAELMHNELLSWLKWALTNLGVHL